MAFNEWRDVTLEYLSGKHSHGESFNIDPQPQEWAIVVYSPSDSTVPSVKIGYNGEVEIREGLSISEAARIFWEAVARMIGREDRSDDNGMRGD